MEFCTVLSYHLTCKKIRHASLEVQWTILFADEQTKKWVDLTEPKNIIHSFSDTLHISSVKFQSIFKTTIDIFINTFCSTIFKLFRCTFIFKISVTTLIEIRHSLFRQPVVEIINVSKWYRRFTVETEQVNFDISTLIEISFQFENIYQNFY